MLTAIPGYMNSMNVFAKMLQKLKNDFIGYGGSKSKSKVIGLSIWFGTGVPTRQDPKVWYGALLGHRNTGIPSWSVVGCG